MPNKPKWIVIHTAAHGTSSQNFDTTVSQIDQWHRNRGFKMIGYHYVVRLGGAIEKGRNESDIGAHTLGLNSMSIGICFSGNGDFHPWTPEQTSAGLNLIRTLMQKYSIPIDHVIGHREVNKLIEQGILQAKYRTSKSCPGKMIDMDAVREQLGG
jgi:N-acetylmuramoyl-L-alanine amidase